MAPGTEKEREKKPSLSSAVVSLNLKKSEVCLEAEENVDAAVCRAQEMLFSAFIKLITLATLSTGRVSMIVKLFTRQFPGRVHVSRGMAGKRKRRRRIWGLTDERSDERVKLVARQAHQSGQVIDVAVGVGHEVLGTHFQLDLDALLQDGLSK